MIFCDGNSAAAAPAGRGPGQARSCRPGLTQPSQRVLLRLTMVGHATLLIQLAGLNILTDPVWSPRVSPLSFAGPKRVNAPGIDFAHLPPIDVVLVSHNHYDHLDLATLARLKAAHDPLVVTPLGNDAIIRAAVPGMRIAARDWGERVGSQGVDHPCRAGASLVGARRARPLAWRCGAASSSRRRRQGLFRRRHRLPCRRATTAQWPKSMAAFAWPSCRSAPTSRAGSWRRSTRIRRRRSRACSSATRPIAAGCHWGTFHLTNEPIDEPRQRLLAALDDRRHSAAAVSADAARRGLGRTMKSAKDWRLPHGDFGATMSVSKERRSHFNEINPGSRARRRNLHVARPSPGTSPIVRRKPKSCCRQATAPARWRNSAARRKHYGQRCRSPSSMSHRSTQPAASASTASVPITSTSLARRSSCTWNLLGTGYGSDGLGNSMIALSVDIAVVSDAGKSLGTHWRRSAVLSCLSLTQPRAVLQSGPFTRPVVDTTGRISV